MQRLKKALLFAMQLLCVVIAALMIAQPKILLPGADTHYVAILDGSGSMRIADAAGETRFSRAQEAVRRDIQKLPWGSSVTVIVAGDEAVVAADHVSTGDADEALKDARCGWGEGTVADAMAICQGMADVGACSLVLLYTDRDDIEAENMEVVDLRGEGEWNVSVLSLEAQGSIYGTAFSAEVVSDGRSANVAFELYLDGKKQDEAKMELRVNGSVQEHSAVYCPAGETVNVSLLVKQAYDYADVRLVAAADDGLMEDNEYHLYAKPKRTTRTLLAGEKTFFLKTALSVFEDVELETAETPGNAVLEGYDLYVFDGCLPDETPQSGAVWMINPPWTPRDTGIVFGDELMGAGITAVQEFTDAQLYTLTDNLALRDASVVRFREVISSGRFAPALLCGKYPLLLAGRTDGGDAHLILPFDLQDSNLPLLTDYVLLIGNMLRYSVPPMLEKQDYDCGFMVYPKTLPQCEKLFLQTPDMSIRALELDSLQEGLRLTMPGGYTLMQELEGGQERILDFFVHMPKGQSRIKPEDSLQTLRIDMPDENGGAAHEQPHMDAQPAELLRLLAAALLLLLTLEWMVYHREQY